MTDFEHAIAIIEARLPLYTDIGQINALRECVSSIRSAALVQAPVQVREIAIKPLEWVAGSWGRELAYGIDGKYAYEVRGPFDGNSAYWMHQGTGLKSVDVGTIEAAKAAAQADYEARIRSALALPLPVQEPVASVARWRFFEAATARGYWGIELEDAGNDDEPILYPIKVHRDTVARIVEAHNDTFASEGQAE